MARISALIVVVLALAGAPVAAQDDAPDLVLTDAGDEYAELALN